MLLLRGLRINYKIYVAVSGSTCQLHDLCGCYGVYLSIIRSTWLFWVLRVNVVASTYVENRFQLVIPKVYYYEDLLFRRSVIPKVH